MKIKYCIIGCSILLFGGLNAQTYPKNGQVFGKEFHQGMDTTALVTTFDGKFLGIIDRIDRGSSKKIPENRTWVFYNDNQNAKNPISFTKGVDGTDGSALWTRIKDEIGIKTTTVTPKHGTVICTFKIGEEKDRNFENAGNKFISRVGDFVFGRVENEIQMVYIPAIGLNFTLEENLNILTSVEREKDIKNISNYTYMANLGLQRNEWQTVAITYDCDKKQLKYFANGKKVAYSKTSLRWDELYTNPKNMEFQLARSDIGDVAVSKIAIYNRTLSNKEVLSLTGGGEKSFAETKGELMPPPIDVNPDWAWFLLAFTLIVTLINIFTGRHQFVPGLTLLIGFVAILMAYIKGMVPVLPIGNFFVGYADTGINFPTNTWEQLNYVTKYKLPDVLLTFIALIALSYRKEDYYSDRSPMRKILNFLVPYGSIVLLYVASGYGAAVVLGAVALLILSSLGEQAFHHTEYPVYAIINKETGEILRYKQGSPGDVIIFGIIIVIVIILIAYIFSSLYLFLFKIYFLFLLVKWLIGFLSNIKDVVKNQ